MTLNRDLIRTRCSEIEDSLDRLDKIGAVTLEAFLADRDMQDIASYRLLVAIEAALSLCYHITAKRLKKVPEEYAECFALLAQAEIIPKNLSDRLQKMARFRNLLIHMYGKIDYAVVYTVVRENLSDLKAFSMIMAGLE